MRFLLGGHALDNQKGLVEVVSEKIWKFLSSVKLAVVLLIILAIVSIIGTVIQQNESPEMYLREYSQTTVNILETLGFFDMYHTWWFVLLLFLLTANLTVCTLDRFPPTWRVIKAPLKPVSDDALKALPFKKEITVKGSAAAAEERAAKALSSHRYPVTRMPGEGSAQLVTQKGAYTRLGYIITHISILLVFVGALIGAFFGFKAFLNLPEGSASKYVYLRNEPMWDRIMDRLGIAKSPVVQNPEAGVPSMPLGYYVQCNSFDVDYYINSAGMPTGMPSEYHSTLSVFDLNGQKILDKRIRVNDPLTFHGITFYQSSYGTMPEAKGKIILHIRPKDKPQASGENVTIDPGQAQFVPSIGRTIRVLGFFPYGLRNPETGQVQFFRTENDEFINPTVELEVLNGTKPVYKTYVMKTDSGTPYMPENYVISFVSYWGARYTGLQVTKDPGVWIVYTGFILLCVGPLIAFFGSHKKLWVRVQERGGQAVVTVAGSANRNRLGFEREFNRIVDEIAK
jgi:cytochrome c biogenesis protein